MMHHVMKNVFQEVLPEFDFVIIYFKETEIKAPIYQK